MEKRCEFCKALSPVVYCSSDAAHLCLSCDAKVHSANALSFRHPRTLVCESCKYRPSHVRCIDHEMFMCQTCDSTHHLALHHRRSVVSCYIGCPSAKELAELWGLDLKESDGRCIESEGGSSRLGTKHKCSFLILQQILDLEMLQEGIDSPCLLHIKERTGGLPFKHDTVWREHKMIDSHLDHSNGHLDFQNRNSPFVEKTDEPLSSPFPQLDNLTNTGNTSNGDSFWQYKSPLHNNEIWLENMQDIGVCDEIRCFDDVNIPDVDLTFRNFEELFDSEKETVRSVVDDDNMECSFADNHPSFGKLDRCFTSTIEDAKKEIDTCNNLHQSQSNHDRPIRPSYSASSLSVSRITGESSGSEYKDDGLYPTFSQHNIENTNLNGKQKATTRYKEKKVLRHEKEADFTSPRPISGFNKRAKSRALKVEGLKRDEGNVTQSF